jgi:small subunit ribosomal protein S6
MNKYESVIIVKPTVDDDHLKEIEKTFTDLINKNGKLEKIDEMGKRKLAYEVKKNTEGIYVVFYFEAEPTLIEELERNYRISDDIIKFIDVRVEE